MEKADRQPESRSSVARTRSFALLGLDALLVDVEVDLATIQSERPQLLIVGLPDSAVRESKDRVGSALKNSGLTLHEKSYVINLAPAHLRKEGALYDLPIALGMLVAQGRLCHGGKLDSYLIAGELGLDGQLRSIRGALAMGLLARDLGLRGLVLPAANGAECATLQREIEVMAFSHLRQVVAFLAGELPVPKKPLDPLSSPPASNSATVEVDFAHVRGQSQAKRALEIAAAGNHNLLLSGPPGSGKSLLARAFAGILPKMAFEEALEVTKIYSIARLLPAGVSLMEQRPFRSPHHTISHGGLVGGGGIPRPGEISLAHHGVLFLDELPEFPRAVLEQLRQPLEEGKVTISRAQSQLTYPCRIICLCAMNPCLCGWWGHPTKPCRCSELQRTHYRSRISGPLWDRLDMQLQVAPVTFDQMHGTQREQAESSLEVRQRVEKARRRQKERFGETLRLNGTMTRHQLASFCPIDEESKRLLRHAMEQLHFSGRGIDKVLRVALTIADLEEAPLAAHHVAEALSLRSEEL